MILQFDLGNSRLKWRLVYTDGPMIGALEPESLESGLRGLPWAQISGVHMVSVADRALTDAVMVLSDSFSMPTCEIVEVNMAQLPEWFTLAETDPKQIGADRVMAMLGAHRRGDDSYCVIDAGTAVTIDLVSKGCHLGGYIAPGLALSRSALGMQTARIGQVRPGVYSALLEPGRDTQHAVEHGARRGLIALCQSVIAEATPSLDRVVLTGGDAGWLAGHLHGVVEVEVDLVFKGLDQFFDALS